MGVANLARHGGYSASIEALVVTSTNNTFGAGPQRGFVSATTKKVQRECNAFQALRHGRIVTGHAAALVPEALARRFLGNDGNP